MSAQHREVMHRKYRMLLQFLDDLRPYAALDRAGRRKEHYAIERLLQLLGASSADLGLQLLKVHGRHLAASYREIFAALRTHLELPEELADRLMDACAMRNVLTHLYDAIDHERVIDSVEPAIALYEQYAEWVSERLQAELRATARRAQADGDDYSDQ